jgi:CPA2 family monovalent cation:H+ antiporter-2
MNQAMRIHQIAVHTMRSDAHIIVCGYGRSGKALGQFLAKEGIKFMALELDPRCVREAAAEGHNVVYGDATKREVLQAAGLMRAKALVITYDDSHSALKILHHISHVRPGLPVVVRTADDTHVEALKRAGAAEVVAEVLEGSVMLASQALLLSGVPLNRVIRRIQEARANRYRVFNSYFRATQGPVGEATETHQARFNSLMINKNDAAIGKTLGQINLAEFNVEVNSVRRHNVEGSHPAIEMVLRAGDVLMLLGEPVSLMAAEKRLRGDNYRD